MQKNIRKLQHAPLPAAVKAAGSFIRKTYAPVLDPSQHRVGYGRIPMVPLQVVDKSFEDNWLDLKLMEIYRKVKDTNMTYKATVDTLVQRFLARFYSKRG